MEGQRLCVEIARTAQSAELLARAALAYGTELASGTIDRQMVALLRQSLAALPDTDSALRARVMARLSAALTPPERADDAPEILALMQGSVRMARELGDHHALLYALQFAATVGLLVSEAERFVVLEETLSLARALRAPLVLLHTLPVYITELLALGRRARAEAMLPEYEALLGPAPQLLHRVRHLLVRALLCELAGDIAAADALAGEAETLSLRGDQATRFLWLIHRLSAAQLRAEPALMREHADALLAQLTAMPSARGYCAWLLLGLGRRERALIELRDPTLEPSGIPSFSLLETLGASESAVLAGDVALGRRMYAALERATDRMFWAMAPGALIGPTARVLGDLAMLCGDGANALRHYDAAIAFCEQLQAPALIALCQRARLSARGLRASEPPLPPSAAEPQFVHEGEVWTIRAPSGKTLRLKHSKGLAYLQQLVEQPGRPVHVIELAGVEHRTGDAGPMLDARAKVAYRERLEQLREREREAEQMGDAARLAGAQQEIEALAQQLAAAIGLGGRDRRAASDVERLRVNVQRRIKDAIGRIAKLDRALGRQLMAAVKTGTVCVYRPV